MRKLFKIFVAALIPFSSSIGSLFAETTGIRPLSEIIEATACENTSVSMTELLIRNSTFYKKFSDQPFCGEIRKFGRVFEGKREGKWTVYHENGQLHAKVFFDNGEKTGPFEQYDDSGLVIAIGNYAKDKRVGYWFEQQYRANGVKIKNIGYYADGERVGEWRYEYGSNKKCSSRTYVKDKPDGKIESYFQNGTRSLLGEYENGKKVGIWEIYHNSSPNLLCAKGDFNSVSQCQFDKDGQQMTNPTDEHTLLLRKIEFAKLRLANSCKVRTGVPSALK